MLPPPASTSDPKSFGYSTVQERWPKIIKGCIDDVSDHPELIPQFEKILQSIEQDLKIIKFTDEEIALNPNLKFYNDNFVDVHWHNGPWLYLECYIYQAINNIFLKANLPHYDIFNRLKQSTLQSSEVGITELCKKLSSLTLDTKDSDKLVLFKEFIDISLWGNSTDLSLLAGDVSLEDIKSIQGEEIRKKNEKNILVNDTKAIFEHLTARSSSGIVDIILDNSGFELFSDLVLAIFLLESKLCSKVNFHCKQIPWFVSDTMIKDFDELFFEISKFHNKHVDKFIENIKAYLAADKMAVVTDPYWTMSGPFWDLAKFPVYETLKSSKLLIFKGDLNYRKLTGDLNWERTTSFAEAIQDLKNANLPIVSLRTCKADVVVGLPEGVDERLVKEAGDFWSASGKYAVISFFNPRQ
ncbi:Hairy/enhancer-of-split with YRPW motif protein 2 [Yamadazyma tenuis]|nr:Hairy/enhancer-of-split with YRPW motif protein 2 [Yamadazyma tenuis]